MKTLFSFIAAILVGNCGPRCGLAQSVIQLDTVYTPPGYEDGPLVASIFIPDPSDAKGIGVVLGHYYQADRLTAKVWCDTLAARGYLAMTIDYYDIGGPPFGLYPKPVRAFKIAIEFLRRNAMRFGLTTNQIVGFGQSQGSLIWGETIIWDNDDAYFGTDSTIDDHLNAAVLLYGAYDNFNYLLGWQDQLLTGYFSPDPSLRATKGQCITNAMNITTPVLLIHGVFDEVLNIAHSRMLRDSLISHNHPCDLVEYNVGHLFDIFSNGGFTSDGLIAKDTVLSFLAQTVTGVSSLDGLEPDRFQLHQNYPNPFNPSTTIKYDLPTDVIVSLKIFNTLGQEVATLINEEQRAGFRSVEWNAAKMASGVYFYQLQAGEFIQVKKLLLLK